MKIIIQTYKLHHLKIYNKLIRHYPRELSLIGRDITYYM